MARPLRYRPDGQVWFEITNRTIQGRPLLRASREFNRLVLGALGRALSQLPSVAIYIFAFASNHFHIILSVPTLADISRFMNRFDSSLARIACRHHGWRDRLWADRFHSIPILDQDALAARVRYILSHGCKEGLVLRPEDWPGASCLPALLHGEKLTGVWIDHTALHRKPRPAGNGDGGGAALATEEVEIEYEVPLTPLPFWAELPVAERQEKARALVADIEAETRKRHARLGTHPLGAPRVLAQEPHQVPLEVKRRRAPACHTSRPELLRAFRQAYRAFAAMFREASRRLRAGEPGAVFPEHCFPPALDYLGSLGPPAPGLPALSPA